MNKTKKYVKYNPENQTFKVSPHMRNIAKEILERKKKDDNISQQLYINKGIGTVADSDAEITGQLTTILGKAAKEKGELTVQDLQDITQSDIIYNLENYHRNAQEGSEKGPWGSTAYTTGEILEFLYVCKDKLAPIEKKMLLLEMKDKTDLSKRVKKFLQEVESLNINDKEEKKYAADQEQRETLIENLFYQHVDGSTLAGIKSALRKMGYNHFSTRQGNLRRDDIISFLKGFTTEHENLLQQIGQDKPKTERKNTPIEYIKGEYKPKTCRFYPSESTMSSMNELNRDIKNQSPYALTFLLSISGNQLTNQGQRTSVIGKLGDNKGKNFLEKKEIEILQQEWVHTNLQRYINSGERTPQNLTHHTAKILLGMAQEARRIPLLNGLNIQGVNNTILLQAKAADTLEIFIEKGVYDIRQNKVSVPKKERSEFKIFISQAFGVHNLNDVIRAIGLESIILDNAVNLRNDENREKIIHKIVRLGKEDAGFKRKYYRKK